MRSFVATLLTPLMIGAGLVACSGSPVDRHATEKGVSSARADTIALDSCAGLDRLAQPQARVLQPGETLPPPRPGSWTNVKHLTFGAFSIDVPTVTTMGRVDSAFAAALDFPTCRFDCSMSVALVRDSRSRSLADYVASLRIVDTAAAPDAASDVPGPARPMTVGPEDGLLMDTPCGDCGSMDLVVKRGNTIAHISTDMDDREGHAPGVMCRLVRAATTFRWLDPDARISTSSSNNH